MKRQKHLKTLLPRTLYKKAGDHLFLFLEVAGSLHPRPNRCQHSREERQLATWNQLAKGELVLLARLAILSILAHPALGLLVLLAAALQLDNLGGLEEILEDQDQG